MSEVPHYAFRLVWSADDGEYVGLCAEFPSMSWLAPTQPLALAGIVDLVEQAVEDLRAAGEPVPEALGERDYSGRLLLRIPPELHRELAVVAAEQGISLNRLISSRLAGAPTRRAS